MKSLCRQLTFILALALLALLLVVFYAARHPILDEYSPPFSLKSWSRPRPRPRPHHPRPALNNPAPKSLWDPARQYLVYLPFEGISNQVYSLQNAATLAKRLNRTLVLPPITSNRHDRLGTNQPWSHYMDIEHMSQHAGIDIVEWQAIKQIDASSRQIIETGSRTSIPKAWKSRAERLPCQVVRNYGRDHFVGEEDSIGADFAYQFLLDLEPIPVPGYASGDNVAYVGDILDSNRNSTAQVICLTFTFTAQFGRDRNRWDISWREAGQYMRFLPRFASYVEDLIAYRFGLLESHVHPHPPLDLGTSILDSGSRAETFLSRKPPHKDYIAIHLRRGDISIKCANRTINDCVVPLSVYKEHVDVIMANLPKDAEQPNVVLVSDTQSLEEKQEIDSYGWYRLDHALDANLLDASKVLGPFSPALIDSAVLTGRSARWVIGSRRSTMSWLAAMRLSTWYNSTIIYPIYPKPTVEQVAQGQAVSGGPDVNKTVAETKAKHTKPGNRTGRKGRTVEKHLWADSVDATIVTWDRHEQQYFDSIVFHHVPQHYSQSPIHH